MKMQTQTWGKASLFAVVVLACLSSYAMAKGLGIAGTYEYSWPSGLETITFNADGTFLVEVFSRDLKTGKLEKKRRKNSGKYGGKYEVVGVSSVRFTTPKGGLETITINGNSFESGLHHVYSRTNKQKRSNK